MVKAGDPLFAMECGLETAARDQAARKLAQAQADLEDAKKGKRPSEIESMQAQVDQARAAAAFSEKIWCGKKNLRPPMRASNEDSDGTDGTTIRIVSASRRWKPI